MGPAESPEFDLAHSFGYCLLLCPPISTFTEALAWQMLRVSVGLCSLECIHPGNTELGVWAEHAVRTYEDGSQDPALRGADRRANTQGSPRPPWELRGGA